MRQQNLPKIGRFFCSLCNPLDRSTCVLFNGGDPSYTISSEWGEYMGTTTCSQGRGNRPSRALFRAITCKPSSNMLNKLIYDTVASHKTPPILSLIASKDLIASLLLILIRTYIRGFALMSSLRFLHSENSLPLEQIWWCCLPRRYCS